MYALMVMMCFPVTMHAGKVDCGSSDWLRVGYYQNSDACVWAANEVANKHKVLARCVIKSDLKD